MTSKRVIITPPPQEKGVIPWQRKEVREVNRTVIERPVGFTANVGEYRGVPSRVVSSSTININVEDVTPAKTNSNNGNGNSNEKNYAASPPPPTPPVPPTTPPTEKNPSPSGNAPWIIGGILGLLFLFLLGIGFFYLLSEIRNKPSFVLWDENDAGRVYDVEERNDGQHPSYTTDSNTSFISGAHGVQLWTSGHNFSAGKAHITYDWVVAPEVSYRIYGEILDANGNSIRREEGTDTGTVSVEIYPSDREKGALSLAVLVVYGKNMDQARSDFIPIDWNQVPSTSSPSPSPSPTPAQNTSPAPASQSSDDGEYIIDTENVSFDN